MGKAWGEILDMDCIHRALGAAYICGLHAWVNSMGM